MKHPANKVAYGDFQTPFELALRCCREVSKHFGEPNVVIEPTCGKASFVLAAAQTFPNAQVIGCEINDSYRRTARRVIKQQHEAKAFAAPKIIKRDFFQADWAAIRQKHSGSVLYLGNPPWVTNSQLGVLESGNLPKKTNAKGVRGIDAMTGQSNFDISESIVQTLLSSMREQDSLAMLVKTATARKVLKSQWKNEQRFSHASVHPIDAKEHFGVSVDACLLMLSPASRTSSNVQVCFASSELGKPAKSIAMGWYVGQLVADPKLASRTSHLEKSPQQNSQPSTSFQQTIVWRSGVKHDVSRVVELSELGGKVCRQDGAAVNVESDRLYPLAKGADVANDRAETSPRRLLITQHTMNESTSSLRQTHPKTFRYLQKNRLAFEGRKSSIYRNRDPFALFGIGPYTFAPWKVAICGLYKRLQFTLIGPAKGRPVVLDDTCYFLPLKNREQAVFVQQLLQSEPATRFFQARIFWDAKRPITADLLRRLDLAALAKACRSSGQYQKLF